MKHRAQTDTLCSTAKNSFMKNTSSFNTHEISSNFSVATKICSLDSYGAPLSTTPAATRHEAPLHHQLPLTPFPCWKLYENPFYVDGKLNPKYISRYLNPPFHRTAHSFTSASQGLQDNAFVSAAAQHYDVAESLNFSSYSADYHQPNTSLPPSSPPSHMAPARNLNPAASAFWEHHELHRLARAQEATMPSDLVNAQALSRPLGLPPSDSLKCPSLHLDCKIPNTTGEERRTNQSKTDMAACSIQATLASILQRLRIVEENQSRSNAVIAKVRLEMEDASSRIQELEFSHESALREINSLLQRFGEQMTTSRRKEQEKLRSAFLRLREEIEEERNTCRLLKLENKKLMKDLEEANSVAADTGEELDRERQARELMEEVCNELAREIGEDKAEVEQLKQEQAKSREMVEEELKMMRMASLWRDERVRTKISEAQLELDDQHQRDMPLQELKSKIEEFVSTVSEVGCEPFKDPMHVEYIEEKQHKIIEQAKMLRQVLELSMQQQLADGGGLVQVQADFNLKEEKILTPITRDQHIYNSGNFCSTASSLTSSAAKIHECKEQCMSHIDRVELQVKPSSYMLNYSKKPCKDIRRPRATSGDDHDYHAANAHQQARKHLLLHDDDVETQQEIGSGKIIIENDHSQALHQSPSPEQLMYESSKIWLASEKHRKDQGLPAVLFGDRNEVQIDESRLLQRSLSSTRTPPKGLHRKQLSLHFDASHEGFGENSDVWEDHVTPSIQVQSYSEDDASHICGDGAGTNARQMTNRRRPTNCICTSQQADDMHPWKSPGQEEMRDDDDIGHHAECLMRHEFEDAKSLCAGGAEGEQHGEFDGFYFEPVMNADAFEGHSIHYVQGDVDDMADDEERSISNVYKSTQQSKSPKEFTKSLLHDGNGRTSARYSGTSAKASCREEAPHKLVVPTPAIRVPLVKPRFTSPKSARSVSPSKPQVLQCFRPPPTSPEHASAAPLFSKSHVKAGIDGVQLVMEAQSSGSSSIQTSKATLLKATSYNKTYTMIGQEGAHQRSRNMGDGEASTSKMLEEKKGNSLRAELLKARETDLQQYVEHVHYNMQKNAAAVAPPPPVKSSTSSSFRFSPLRKSLNSNSHGSR